MGSRQPKWRDILGAAAFPPAGVEWKLHVKDVPRIDMQMVEEIDGGVETLRNFQRVRRWLDVDDEYASVPIKGSRGAPSTKFSDSWIESLEKFGVIVPVERHEVRGWVHMFAVPEPAKERFRPIKHTRDVNDTLDKKSLMQIHFPMKRDICELVHRGDCFIALDFAAYYDQFVYSEEVGERFCFRRGNRYFRLNTLAMGQRQAVEVAACTTARLLDFQKTSTTASIIDNVIFVGSREEVVRDASEFVRRVKLVNGLLNEDVSDIEALVQTVGDWGGIHLDFTQKTACLAQKTVDKTQLSWDNRETWTWRTFAAHVGLLFWAWQLIDLPMPDFFPVLRFISAAGRHLTENEDAWDMPAQIWPSAWVSLKQWTSLVLKNAPRKVLESQPPEWIVCTDACERGWGYVAVNNSTGEVRTHGAAWTPKFLQLYGDRVGISTFSEPQAIVNALCHLFPPSTSARVRIVTDNTVARASFDRGYNARSYHINHCMQHLQSVFGKNLQLDFVYVAGAWNVSDPWSRGRTTPYSDMEMGLVSAEMRRIWGLADCPREVRVASDFAPPKYAMPHQ